MAFAAVADVEVRLGRSLTTAEEAMAEQVIEGVTGLIAEAAGKTAAWAAALSPVDPILKLLCIEKVIAVGSNPNGLQSASEQLGAYQKSQTYRKPAAGFADIFLTQVERALVRRVVIGSPLVSGKTPPPIEEDTDYAFAS